VYANPLLSVVLSFRFVDRPFAPVIALACPLLGVDLSFRFADRSVAPVIALAYLSYVSLSHRFATFGKFFRCARSHV
jgi:hypothetical protein